MDTEKDPIIKAIEDIEDIGGVEVKTIGETRTNVNMSRLEILNETDGNDEAYNYHIAMDEGEMKLTVWPASETTLGDIQPRTLHIVGYNDEHPWENEVENEDQLKGFILGFMQGREKYIYGGH